MCVNYFGKTVWNIWSILWSYDGYYGAMEGFLCVIYTSEKNVLVSEHLMSYYVDL